tara:strand:+ start:425 stop:931 length:507 start_codon:yes stop_codon:yes gene_type:complete
MEKKRKRGGQTVYTEEKADEILARLSEGESLRSICKDDHLPAASSVIGWVMDDREGFKEQYARARKIQGDVLFDKLIELSQKAFQNATGAPGTGEASAKVQAIRLEVDALKWSLSKLHPERYSDFRRNELTGKAGGPIKQEASFLLTKEDEEKIRQIADTRNKIKDES